MRSAAAAKVEKAVNQLIDLLLAKQDDSATDSEIANYLRDNEASMSSSSDVNPAASTTATPAARRPFSFTRPLRESNLTPLQQLVLEEVGKLLGAGIRSSWSSLRDASGYLPSGRSVLGAAVDPLGLFKGSGMHQL
jgi:hypothetical protein